MSNGKGVCNIHDDIVVTGKNKIEHDENLRGLLQCFSENDLTVCVDKYIMRQPSIEFMGENPKRESSSFKTRSRPFKKRLILKH